MLSLRSRILVGFAASVAAVLGASFPPIAAADSIAPGFDLFETDPQQTGIQFHSPETELPAGFFGAGSDPFDGIVQLGGVPLGSFMGHDVGNSDTIVHRLDGGTFPVSPPRTIGPIPIEIVALNLVSMQPITVRYNGGQNPEAWTVDVSLSAQPQQHGQMGVTKSNPQGGTFSAQLPVLPLLTFTRISDGHTIVLDAASVPSAQNAFNFQINNAVWDAAGCSLPALAVSTFNDDFCAGQAQTGLVPTQALAQRAIHTVYPGQPALEHFKCYTVEKQDFNARQVIEQDQFRLAPLDVTKRAELCNPAQKNKEPFKNRRAHLQCYVTTGGQDLQAQVAVQNQFGTQLLRVHEPQRLCLPTQKRLLSQNALPKIKVPIDHYECYRVTQDGGLQSANPVSKVKLTDEFGIEKQVTVGPAFQLCAPATKTFHSTTTRAQHQVQHLVCYRIKQPQVRRRVEIKNQFEQKKLKTVRPVSLCVPSNKYVVS